MLAYTTDYSGNFVDLSPVMPCWWRSSVDWREGNLCLVQDLSAGAVPYRYVSEPTSARRYYVLEELIVRLPPVTPGEILGQGDSGRTPLITGFGRLFAGYSHVN
jgi:hypothetical protein